MSKVTAIQKLKEMIAERDDGFNRATVAALRDILAELETDAEDKP
jgi:hypothetical protein